MITLNEIIIDPEFRDLIPAPTEEERLGLMKSIEQHGFRDRLVVWLNHGILLDGHTRYGIWQQFYQGDQDREPEVVEVHFKDREAAHDWVIDNQLARRNISPELACDHGAGPHSTSRLCGTVRLDDKWVLGVNKTRVVDDDWDALGVAVQMQIGGMLAEADRMSRHLESDALRRNVEEQLNDALREIGQAKRPNRNGKKGTVPAKGTSRTVRQAARVAGSGVVRGPRSIAGGRIRIDYHHKGEDAPLFEVDCLGGRVILNEDRAWIQRTIKANNIDALNTLVCMAFVQAHPSMVSRALPGTPDEHREDAFSHGASLLLETLKTESQAIEAA